MPNAFGLRWTLNCQSILITDYLPGANVLELFSNSERVMNSRRIIWLNVTGSGNETAAHVQLTSRMTLMFAAFSGRPMILRVYSTARVIHQKDPEWSGLYSLFDPLPGARQIFDLDIDLVQTSCGMAVPLFDYAGDREQFNRWAEKQGEVGIREYWRQKNQRSIDGLNTDIVKNNLD
jgi:hypothetical protein